MAKLKIFNKYATVPNELLNNTLISLKSKGLYAYIQSKPDDWDFSAERISIQLKEGLPSIKSALKELEKYGYLFRRRYQNLKGFWEVEYILYENPSVEILTVGKPTEENPTIGKTSNNTNTINTNKDSLSKNKYKKIAGEFYLSENRVEILNMWMNYKKEKKSQYTEIGIKQLIKNWADKTDEQLEEAVRHSISNNWQGLFPPKQSIQPIEKKGKFQTNLENISQAAQNILDSHDNGTYQNPFDRF